MFFSFTITFRFLLQKYDRKTDKPLSVNEIGKDWEKLGRIGKFLGKVIGKYMGKLQRVSSCRFFVALVTLMSKSICIFAK